MRSRVARPFGLDKLPSPIATPTRYANFSLSMFSPVPEVGLESYRFSTPFQFTRNMNSSQIMEKGFKSHTEASGCFLSGT